MKLKLENKTSLIIGAIVVLILLFDFFIFLRPQLSALALTSGKCSASSQELKTARRDIVSMGQYKRRLSTLKEQILTVGERISQEEEIPIILENISKIAKQSFLKINYIKPERDSEQIVAKTQTGDIYELPITIQARCGYHQLGSFINMLENDKVTMYITSLEILPNPEDALRRRIKMVVATYILKK